ncbi:MAG: tetratricopeptide repeat protein, partial [Deltaproteobacteria bacterium]|nr:tetratricopeptide repeat protein [Deltaproteobacteria bacterium]
VATTPKPFVLAVCSDAASRPLGERRVLWQQRLQSAKGGDDMLRVFREAGQRCELMTAHQRKVLLDLIAMRLTTAAEVRDVLLAFSQYPVAERYLRRWVRRTFLDADNTLGLYMGSTVNWGAIKTGLAALKSPEARLAEMRRVTSLHPDPTGKELLIAVLVENGLLDEARREAEKLHRQGDASPEVLVTLCDILADTGQERPARRICSELVEFNAQNTIVRQKLGDIFLRHGWYDDAYRQYATLVDDTPDNPVALLRLALAAAGMGKTDEALRIARKVAASDGETGEADPRPWARALSVALLARMLNQAQSEKNPSLTAAIEQQLKRTGMFATHRQMQVLLWEDFEFSPVVRLMAKDTPVTAAGEVVASMVGVMLYDLGEAPPAGWTVALAPAKTSQNTAAPLLQSAREVVVKRIRIEFDGTHFKVDFQSEAVPNA